MSSFWASNLKSIGDKTDKPKSLIYYSSLGVSKKKKRTQKSEQIQSDKRQIQTKVNPT